MADSSAMRKININTKHKDQLQLSHQIVHIILDD